MPLRFIGASLFALTVATPAIAAQATTDARPADTAILERLNALEDKIKALEARNAALEGQIKAGDAKAAKSNGVVPIFTDSGGATSFKVRGVIDADYVAFNERRGGYDFNNGTAFRRARLGFEGTAFKDFNWRIEADFAGNSVNLQDAYVQYTGIRPLQITLGQHKAPFGLESNNSDNFNVFLERGMFNVAAGNLGAERRIGASVAYVKDSYTVTAGIFGDNESIGRAATGDTDTPDESWGFNARATWEPLLESGRILHFGASTYWHTGLRTTTASGARLSDRPNIRVDNGNIIDTGLIADAHSALYYGVEATGIFGPFTLAGEYGRVEIDRQPLTPIAVSDPGFDGFYIFGTWFLTGESRPFKNGNFDRVKPLHNFDGKGGIGAWEVALRYDQADLSETPVAARGGNKAHSWTAGINWYWNPNLKLQFNYIRFSGTNTPLDPTGTRTDGDAYATRLHIDW